MFIFWSRNDDGEATEVGRIWIQDGIIQASGSERVLAIAKEPIETTFGDEVDPVGDPEAFLDAILMRYHGTYFFATEVPDETPTQV